MYVHTAARFAVDGLGHEGGGLSGLGGGVLDDVLGNHGLVGHFRQVLRLHLHLQLAGSAHLVVVVLDLYAPVVHFQADVVAQVIGDILGERGVVAVVMGDLIALAVRKAGVPISLPGVQAEAAHIGAAHKGRAVEDIELKLRTDNRLVRDAGFPHVLLRPLCDRPGILAETMVFRLLDDQHVAGHGQGRQGGEGVQLSGIRVRDKDHVALFHGCVAKVGTVESDAAAEGVLTEPLGRDGDMAPAALEVNRFEINELDVVFPAERQDFCNFFGHSTPQ